MSQLNSIAMSEKKKSPPVDPDKEYPEIKPYPARDDTYNQAEEEQDIDPEDPTKLKKHIPKPSRKNEKDFDEDMTAEDLDIPGNDADERDRGNGGEDEENNYYSLGGDKKK